MPKNNDYFEGYGEELRLALKRAKRSPAPTHEGTCRTPPARFIPSPDICYIEEEKGRSHLLLEVIGIKPDRWETGSKFPEPTHEGTCRTPPAAMASELPFGDRFEDPFWKPEPVLPEPVPDYSKRIERIENNEKDFLDLKRKKPEPWETCRIPPAAMASELPFGNQFEDPFCRDEPIPPAPVLDYSERIKRKDFTTNEENPFDKKPEPETNIESLLGKTITDIEGISGKLLGKQAKQVALARINNDAYIASEAAAVAARYICTQAGEIGAYAKLKEAVDSRFREEAAQGLAEWVTLLTNPEDITFLKNREVLSAEPVDKFSMARTAQVALGLRVNSEVKAAYVRRVAERAGEILGIGEGEDPYDGIFPMEISL